MARRGEIFIGTSGWHYRHWVGRFYPEQSSGAAMFRYYVQHFHTVELNNSFYKLPEVATLRGWREATPSDLRFAVKASRFITHNKKLNDAEATLDRFLPRVEALGAKLGPVLFQLPPSWKLNLERLRDFLSLLPRRHRYAFEFRETSWNVPAVYELLGKYNAAFCIYELGGYRSPLEVTADWVYVRLHGPEGKYQGRYGMSSLRQWAARIGEWSAQLKPVYVYFDNDESAYAPDNALQLTRLVRHRLAPGSANRAA